MDLTDDSPDGEVKIHKKDFHHPYTPYPIQEKFMQTVYDVLEQGKIGILESPTGTGKSLSLICGSLTWLRDFKRKEFEGILNDGFENSEEPEWMIEAAKVRKKRELIGRREEMERKLGRIRERERCERDRMSGNGNGNMRGGKRRKVGGDGEGDLVGGSNGSNEDEFLLEDWESDGEIGGSGKKKTGDEAIFSKETLELKKSIGMWKFPSPMPLEEFPSKTTEKDKDNLHEHLRHLPLGSRKNLCINPKVNKLNSVTAINERCAELQQSSTPKEHKCPHLPNKDNKPLVSTFRDHALATIRDIEDMGALGKEISICPYYASRSAIKPAEIVTLPYPLLLQKSAREALGISLKGHVVIIDEAHNLMDAIAGIYGTEMSLKELKLAKEMLGNYFMKFAKRLKGKNRIYVAQAIRVVDSLMGYLMKRLEGTEIDGVVDQKELLAGKGADQIDLFKLIRYLQESKLARKVESYTEHTRNIKQASTIPHNNKETPKSTTPILHTLTSLLLALTHPTTEGQLFFLKSTSTSPSPSPDLITLKFQLLNPAPHFESIVSSARAIILAGGTMSPFSDYTSILFPSIPSHKITTLSCGHVIPKTHLFASTVSRGPTGIPFKWTFANRGNTDMMDELGRVLLNVCTIVPDGVVVFFPSYNFLSTILYRFSIPSSGTGSATATATGTEKGKGKTILERLSEKKPIFQESKEESVETILAAYAKSIAEGKGALLFSVVGGKLSEGINFSDALGRCVMIVGLPFPNMHTAEWKRRLRFIEESAVERLTSFYQEKESNNKDGNGNEEEGNGKKKENREKIQRDQILQQAKGEARDYFENVCMRAVNQCVGRAIRHRGDWAGILLLDERYKGERVVGKLAGWIREGVLRGEGMGMGDAGGFGRLMGGLGRFCRGRREVL
ncbi:hypothetical protein SS1G_07915 [Sclerotinia sclerotiorum 1980 UF-70]|uniref:ATP-dependent DNA helicase CHL1 n=1 Tax=Sclerotinia sclerotiorum (strain ATCC 18683 / 1980 / Ss-1) TaxID=665079 RepID=CHL1_SCLS1|nr:hypothetical protein SS1G_07915 [Sclerotinia sclerotiorum 1980 UF-70]A7ERG1.1 RecName: Full=ATP-dependent DNA helicase CHL1; AltName: Full=Chromosome loss protein 1 [Sclerotinia sclerotiorum 1980 UF-70]EDN92053.1 hypothetical protein SS1G_07915 [Sclerotinia sclerotiorum 1980 UF-70]